MTKGADGCELKPMRIGLDGFAMLALSGAIMLFSLGTSLLLALGYVLRIALGTPTDGPPPTRIIVLGMRANRNGDVRPYYYARLNRALALWRQSERSQIIILGGITTPGARSEARAGAECLCEKGVPSAAIETEDRSRHTLENLLLYRERYGSCRTELPVLVTSRFHMARSSLRAAGLGIAHRRCAAEDQRLAVLRHTPRMLLEALLIHWYITSRSFALLTRNRHIAVRIT